MDVSGAVADETTFGALVKGEAPEMFGTLGAFGSARRVASPFVPEGLLSFAVLSDAVLSDAGVVFAGVLTGTGAFVPGFVGASLVEGTAAAGGGVTADAASPVRVLGWEVFVSRVEEGFFSSFFGESAVELPELFSSASGPTRTPSDWWNTAARA